LNLRIEIGTADIDSPFEDDSNRKIVSFGVPNLQRCRDGKSNPRLQLGVHDQPEPVFTMARN
jgi:hypothetical protein